MPALIEKVDKDSDSPTKCDGNLHDQACIEKVDDGVGASDSPSTPVDLSDSALVRTESADCGSDIQISTKEATSVQCNVEKKLPESSTKSMPSSPSGASLGNADSGDVSSGPSTEVDDQSSEPVHQKLCISLDEASARNIEVEKQNEELLDNISIDANGKGLSADTKASCFKEPAAPSAEEEDETKISVCDSATCESTKPSIDVLSDSTQPSTPGMQNGRNVALKQTSDIKRLDDGDVSLEEGNLDSSSIGDGVNDNNGAEVSSSKPAIDSSVETFLNAAPENNTDCQLSLCPGSQACGLNPSDGCSGAKVSVDERIVHSDPGQAETHEVTVAGSCSGTVDSSADVSAELADEEKS